MFAIVDIAGQQFKVEEKMKYNVPRLEAELNSTILFDFVRVLSDESLISIGNPIVESAKVEAKVIEHLKDDKVIVFKKTRRKSYQKFNTHRQQLTKIEITKIIK
ncbi:MAG: 50S ribosomal protein L21 [Ignavibacteriales bacterium]|nr:50S ribosomal protein L21 [Ignavibacteriales bacterium]